MKWDEEGRNNFMEKIYHQYYRALMQQALHYLCFERQYYDMAHDAVMDTFEVAYLSWDTFIHHPNPDGWLRLVLRRKLSAKMKRVYADDGVTLELDELHFSYFSVAESEDEVEKLIRDHDNKALVERLMKRLKVKERRLIQMYYFEDKSSAEIAAFHNTTERVVNTQLYRIRKKMKKIFESSLFLLIWMLCFRI